MAEIKAAFNSENHHFDKLNYDNGLDYFFTCRKIADYEEYIDVNMARQKKKITTNHNFLAINFPSSLTSDNNHLTIEIWGDKGYQYKGEIINTHGYCPHILVRLSGDSQIFVKLNKKDENKNIVNFIHIPKRYQHKPLDNTLDL
jgi:hypothetical protein